MWTEALRAADQQRAITFDRHVMDSLRVAVSEAKAKWTPPPPPRAHQWMASTTGGVSLCANCGVMREGVFAKLNCGTPVNNQPRAETTA